MVTPSRHPFPLWKSLTALLPPGEEAGERITIRCDGAERGVLLNRAEGVAGPAPLIILLHGAALSGSLTHRNLRLPALARRAGLALAFPDAEGLLWAEGSLDRAAPGLHAGHDDIAFLDALIGQLVADGIADAQAIHLAGISNGGMMAMRYAAERGERLASVMAFLATLPREAETAREPDQPVPFLMLAGTADPVVGWDGEVRLAGRLIQRRRSVPETFAAWRRANRCTGLAASEILPRRGAADAPDVVLHAATGGTETRLYEVRGGGHRMPGGADLSPLRLLGRATPDVDADALMLGFAQRHRRDDAGVAKPRAG
jgi:polyhydroxybutyrate depolymerase